MLLFEAVGSVTLGLVVDTVNMQFQLHASLDIVRLMRVGSTHFHV